MSFIFNAKSALFVIFGILTFLACNKDKNNTLYESLNDFFDSQLNEAIRLLD